MVRLPPKGVHTVKMEGPRGPGELDLRSSPSGASIIYKKRVIGKTPARVILKPSKLYTFYLHRDRYRFYKRRVRMPSSKGREVTVYLKKMRGRSRLAKKRRTGIKVICRTKGVFRIYLNGRDTGYTCPATIASGVGRQSIGLYFPHTDRTSFRKVRARYRRHVKMKWKY